MLSKEQIKQIENNKNIFFCSIIAKGMSYIPSSSSSCSYASLQALPYR